MPTHSQADGTPCSGVLVWGKDTAKLKFRSVVRRECPLCGFREQYNPKLARWLEHARNEHPGTGRWVTGS